MSDPIDIGEYRISRARARSPYGPDAGCMHKHMTIEHGDVVRCDDCGVQVDTFWALQRLCEQAQEWHRKLSRQFAQLKADQDAILHLSAARVVEQAWRSRTMMPACPHCGCGIGAADGFGLSKISREIEMRRRKVAAEKR